MRQLRREDQKPAAALAPEGYQQMAEEDLADAQAYLPVIDDISGE